MPDNLAFMTFDQRFNGPAPPIAARPPLPNPFEGGQVNLDALIALGTSRSLSYLWMVALGCRVAYTGDTTKIADVAANLGATEYRVFNGWSPLIPRMIRFTSAGGRKLYCLSGTTNLAQWVKLFWATDQVPATGGVGRVYQAFAEVADAGWADFLADLNGIPNSVVLAGHSLGAAIAQIWGNRIAKSVKDTQPRGVITFGAPRVGDETFARYQFRPETMRVCTKDDIVTRVPPRTWTRKPDGALSVAGSVVPCEYVHTYGDGRFLREFGADDFVGDTTTNADCVKALRLANSLTSPNAAHLLPFYAAKMLEFANLHERVTPARLAQYLALDARLRAAGL